MIVFLAKITNRKNVDQVLKHEPFIHEDIYNFETEIKVGMPVFIYFSGDRSQIDWKQGLVGVGKIEKEPYDKGYSHKNQRYFRIQVTPVLVLGQPLDPKFTKLHPEFQNELYDVPYVGANHFPNQAIAKATGGGAIALFNVLKSYDKSDSLLEFKDYIASSLGDQDVKKEFRKYLLKKNEPSTVGSYINALDNIPKYLESVGKSCDFKWSRNVNIDSLKKSAEFVKAESKKDLGGVLENYKPKSHYNNGWVFSGISNFISFLNDIPEPETEATKFNIHELLSSLTTAGLVFNKSLVVQFIAALFSKKFVILTGLSGSGKTKLALSFVKWICQNNSQYKLIPVGADWTNREPLLGYPNALKPDEYIRPENGALDLLVQASENESLPYFLILDEMNLSHVERYFSDFLSAMESNDEIPLHSGKVTDDTPPCIKLPENLFIIGTVNIDETTYMFSPKVLDRANTIEFRVTKEEIESFIENAAEIDMSQLEYKGAPMGNSFLERAKSKISSGAIEPVKHSLVSFFENLKKVGAEFGYRSTWEIMKLIHNLGSIDRDLSDSQKLDIAIMHKLLPKLHGSRRKLCPILISLAELCVIDKINIENDVFTKDDFDFSNDSVVKFPLSLEKITRMYRCAIDNGFASYAEA